ncbi:MAG: hypothetical protein WKF84_01265 [Pyrinomonadaceae bacterium]
MARGWESKAIEGQLEEAEARAQRRSQQRSGPESPAERERAERLEALRLSRTRTLSQIEAARNQAHRLMLERALAHLDGQIEELSKSNAQMSDKL